MSFDPDYFSRQLIAESLFYDAEYAALGTLSLIDLESSRECIIAAYSPDEEMFVVELATEWEEYEPGNEDDIGYALAVDSDELGTYATADEAADVLLAKARELNLLPSMTMLFSEEEIN
jgi:hypothetical protein